MTNPSIPPVLINWPLFALPNETGEIQYPSLDASVRQSIRIILSTRPGEQLMRPSFGAGLENFVHEQNTILTRRRIHDLIVESLDTWEKRIQIDRVEVNEVADDPGQIRVEILYRLRRTGAAQQLGMTLQLDGT
jgi:phage baseplate assembly protein W